MLCDTKHTRDAFNTNGKIELFVCINVDDDDVQDDDINIHRHRPIANYHRLKITVIINLIEAIVNHFLFFLFFFFFYALLSSVLRSGYIILFIIIFLLLLLLYTLHCTLDGSWLLCWIFACAYYIYRIGWCVCVCLCCFSLFYVLFPLKIIYSHSSSLKNSFSKCLLYLLNLMHRNDWYTNQNRLIFIYWPFCFSCKCPSECFHNNEPASSLLFAWPFI